MKIKFNKPSVGEILFQNKNMVIYYDEYSVFDEIHCIIRRKDKNSEITWIFTSETRLISFGFHEHEILPKFKCVRIRKRNKNRIIETEIKLKRSQKL